MSNRPDRQVFVSIGSNVDREHNIRAAVAALRERFTKVDLSPVYESPAEGFEGAPFFNLVAHFRTDMVLADLLAALREIEQAIGRDRSGSRLGPRTIDLDLLTCGELIVSEGRKPIPRHDILQYAFVLKPLSELAPEAVHPELGERYEVLWQRFAGKAQLRRVEIDWQAG